MQASQATSGKIVELEALRGLAAIVVLVHHFMLGFAPRLHGLLYPEQPLSIFGTPAFAFVNGSAAVVVFFVLSGFVLTVGLFRSPDLGRGFVAVLRRWPRLAATVTISNVLAGTLMAYGLFSNTHIAQLVPSLWLSWFYVSPGSGYADLSRAAIEGATTFFTGAADYNNNLWTMYYEFWGSLIAIGCAMVCTQTPSRILRFIILAAVWLVTFYWSPYLSTFAIGVWLASEFTIKPTTTWPAWSLYFFLPALVILTGYHENLISSRAEGWYAFLNPLVHLDPLRVRITLHSIAAAALILLFVRVAPLRIAMSGRVGYGLGFMSFAIYLVQIPVICSVSSWTYGALEQASRAVRLGATFAVTASSTILLAIPLAFFDRWWVRRLGDLTRRP